MSVVKNRPIGTPHIDHAPPRIYRQVGRLKGTSTTTEQLTLKNREIRKFVIWQGWDKKNFLIFNLLTFEVEYFVPCHNVDVSGHASPTTQHQKKTSWTSFRRLQAVFDVFEKVDIQLTLKKLWIIFAILYDFQQETWYCAISF